MLGEQISEGLLSEFLKRRLAIARQQPQRGPRFLINLHTLAGISSYFAVALPASIAVRARAMTSAGVL